jgi:hypothetical protein
MARDRRAVLSPDRLTATRDIEHSQAAVLAERLRGEE